MDPSDQPPPADDTYTNESYIASGAIKRQRQPSQSPPPDNLAPGPSDETASARSRKTLKQPPTLRGSSRDTNEMHRSSPEASGSIKYTRTGRVSKATKGQRVHHCEECGKTYTRAEHLRRHQQNHKPGAFPCDFPNCSRSFYREDLLIRHRARHNDPLNPPSRRHSVGSQSSAPDAGAFGPSSVSTSGLAHPPTSQPFLAPELQQITPEHDVQQPNPTSRAPPKRQPVPPNELTLGSVPLSSGPVPINNGGGRHFQNPFSPGSPLSPPYEYEDESPDEQLGVPFEPSPLSRPRYCSDASYLAYEQVTSASRSPVSAVSSTLYLPQRPHQGGWNAPYPIPSHAVGHISHEDQAAFNSLSYGSSIAEYRDWNEIGQLTVPGLYIPTMSDNLDDLQFSRYNHCLDAFWSRVHSLYPILHKPTYDNVNTSPLLRAAVLALGGQALGDPANLTMTRALHERCLKVLKKRNIQNQNTWRVCDMQAVVLVEIFSIFKSRRPPLQLSKNFELVYQYLQIGRSSSELRAQHQASANTPAGDDAWINLLFKQRLLLACYALEQQHNILFGRTSGIGFASNGLNVPFPASQARWDDDNVFELAALGYSRYALVSEAASALPYATTESSEPLDTFQSMLVMACSCDPSINVLDLADCRKDYSSPDAMERSPRTKLAYHTVAVCKNTPVRQVLAVAGESWVMAEKLTTQAEYIDAQHEVRAWATDAIAGSEKDIRCAVEHALRILDIHRSSPKTGLLFQEWSVHLAAVVIWAYAYMVQRTGRASHTTSTISAEATPSPYETEQAISALISTGPTAITGWLEARNVLAWVKIKIVDVVPHTCGLVSGSLDVLGKLLARGDKEGWF